MNYQKLKAKQEVFYKSIVSVFCPILNETVYFTSEGFRHLLYKNYRRPRNLKERYMKLKFLSYAPDVIRNCSLVSETRKVDRKIKRKLKGAIHYELVSQITSGANIRVIVEKIGTGHHKFRSIMPHDKKSKLLLATKKRR